MASKQTDILIIDTHELFRTGLALLLDDENTIGRIETASSGEEGLQILTDYLPSVILLDLNIPGYGGIETTRKITYFNRSIKIIIISSFSQEPFPLRLMELGAHAYLHKNISKTNLLGAISAVQDGHAYLDPAIEKQITIDKFDKNHETPFSSLTTRELQIALFLVKAIPVTTISDYLCISTKTVCGYRYTMFDKLDIETDVELTQLAYRHHLLVESIP